MSKHNKIDWFIEYDRLRDMHTILKSLRNELVCGRPHFGGNPRDLPVEYESLLDRIDNVLYSAEAFVSKRMY